MTRDEILRLLGEHRPDLDRLGVKSLALFGSAARNEGGQASDVDLLVEFEGPETFDQYMALKFFLEDLLGCPVDLGSREALKPRLRPYVERDLIYVP